MKHLTIDLPAEVSGKAIELVTQRKGEMIVIEPKGDLIHLEFDIPSRGLIGLRNNMLTATSGEAVMHHRFRAYDIYKGDDLMPKQNGSLISLDQGMAQATQSTACRTGEDFTLIRENMFIKAR